MNISSNHNIEIYVNNELLELESQDGLNLHINNVLFNPTKVATKQAEFSYSFNIPSTPKNDKIFDYANTLSKLNKFRNRYSTTVYSDGILLFDGSMIVRGYSAKDKMYECNIVNIKVNSLEEIFGEATLSEAEWIVGFNGESTINQVNQDLSSKYYFPFVCYGAFGKDYVTRDEVGATYTPKHDLDKYNRWYIDSLLPSLNMLEEVRKLFEWKGYNVDGTAFHDPNISNIYCSANLASEQNFEYNLGNPKMGKINLTTTWSTSSAETQNFQDLKFPYWKITPFSPVSVNETQEEYNWSGIRWYNMLSQSNGASVTVNEPTYLYRPNNDIIVIPQSGWYKIKLNINATLNKDVPSFQALQWTNTSTLGEPFEKRNVWIDKGFQMCTPFEVQLIRNYDDNIELIKGKSNIECLNGFPRDIRITINDYDGGAIIIDKQNLLEWTTSYPHEDYCGARIPTKTTELVRSAVADNSTSTSRSSYRVNGAEYTKALSLTDVGMTYRNENVMPYDPAVSNAFICGFTTYGLGTMSIMRNGGSWTKMVTEGNKVFADVKGLERLTLDGRLYPTSYSANEYKDSENYIHSDDDSISGQVECCVWLEKDDKLELVGVLRDYLLDGAQETSDYPSPYTVNCTANLVIEAMSTRNQEVLKADNNWGYLSSTEMPKQLNLFKFCNSEIKISDWISNIAKAFNLDIVQNGTDIEINTNQGVNKNISYTIDLDNRVNNDEAETQLIEYPKEMSVRYKIDTDEWGFEQTVPSDHIDDADWKDYGDSGYTIIKLNDDTYISDTQNTQTNFSYTYYDNFTWKEVLSSGTETSVSRIISTPTIEKAEFMAEGYGQEEAERHDGFSLPQRFWYRQPLSNEYIWTCYNDKEIIYLTYPSNIRNGFNLSYKDTEKSIVTEYFNICPMLSSNYVEVEAYITAEEYEAIKNGALIHFDSNLHYISQLEYNPTGISKLKMIQKI